MSATSRPAVIAVIDDLYGRTVLDGTNAERQILCAQFLLRDVTPGAKTRTEIADPVADAVFVRGQRPVDASAGDVVENTLDDVLAAVRCGAPGRLGSHEDWAAVLVDLCFYTGVVAQTSEPAGVAVGLPDDDTPGGYFGLHVLAALQERFPTVPVMVFSSKPRAPVAEQFSALGALAFLERTHSRGADALADLLQLHGLLDDPDDRLLGSSAAIRMALRAARRCARGDRHLLLRGERGTGKELLASFVHRHSRRGDGPFVSVDVGAVPASLTSSELFGHRRGAFTGADADRSGRFHLADSGDLFLDEISNATQELQVALLRVLETGEFSPVGDSRTLTTDVRVISATNEDLETVVASGKFRADLLDRLRAGGIVLLPPLRERGSDVLALADHFLAAAVALTPGAVSRTLSESAKDLLVDHRWPGNVRELRQVITESVIAYPSLEFLHPQHLRSLLGEGASAGGRNDVRAAGPIMDAQSPRDLARRLAAWNPVHLGPAELTGSLPHVDRAAAAILARMLAFAVEATRRRTAMSPQGLLQLSTAVRMLTGDPAVTSTQAADLVKRMLAPLGEGLDEIPAGAKEALVAARRMRPQTRSRPA